MVLFTFFSSLELTGNSSSQEDSSRLLARLMRSSGGLIRPYCKPILSILLVKLNDNNPRVRSYVLSTMGELARASGRDLCPHIDVIMNYIIDTLHDQVSVRKRQTAIRSLGQLARATGKLLHSFLFVYYNFFNPYYSGFVIDPFHRHPELLGILLNEMKRQGNVSYEIELMKVLGILGALDPDVYRQELLRLRNVSSLLKCSCNMLTLSL